jgi:hypothetical protein
MNMEPRSLVHIARQETNYWNGQPAGCTRMAVYGMPTNDFTLHVGRLCPQFEALFDPSSRAR